MSARRRRVRMPGMIRKAVVSVVCLAGCLCGCVERKMTITSEPDGAIVFVSDVEKGRTPLTMSFTWYGDYDILIRKEGYRTLKTHARIDPPWYEFPPLDLFSGLAPWTYRDRRYLHYGMEELVLPTDEQLIDRAERMEETTLEPVKR